MNYAPPESSPNCACRRQGQQQAAILCPTGHLTECHHPLGCREAACSHLTRYEEITQGEMAALEELAVGRLERLARADCSECQGSGRTDHTTEMETPAHLAGALGPTITFHRTSVCTCVG